MIFLGDLSVPDKRHLDLLVKDIEASGIFKDETVILNLEGVLLYENPTDCFWKVYNCKEVLQLAKCCKKLIVSLANNHLYDFPEGIKPMVSMLKDNCIDYFGLYEGDNIKPLEFVSNDVEYAIFGHCWQLYTRTNPNLTTDDRLVDCTYQRLFDTIVDYMGSNPDTKVICFPHWNFDLECYPFPAYRKFARDLIDAGVEAVIGNHAHCQQDVELYHGKVIAYGLGNFYMPSGVYFNGLLKFPKVSQQMCMIKLHEKISEDHIIYDCTTDTDGHAFKVVRTRKPIEDTRGFDEYKVFFKQNRKKKKFVPVFNDYNDSVANRLKLGYLVSRVNIIRFIKKILNKGL